MVAQEMALALLLFTQVLEKITHVPKWASDLCFQSSYSSANIIWPKKLFGGASLKGLRDSLFRNLSIRTPALMHNDKQRGRIRDLQTFSADFIEQSIYHRQLVEQCQGF